MSGAQVQCLGQEDPLEEGMATHSSILAWKIPRTEDPGGLLYTGSHRVGRDRSLSAHARTFFHSLMNLFESAELSYHRKGHLVQFLIIR